MQKKLQTLAWMKPKMLKIQSESDSFFLFSHLTWCFLLICRKFLNLISIVQRNNDEEKELLTVLLLLHHWFPLSYCLKLLPAFLSARDILLCKLTHVNDKTFLSCALHKKWFFLCKNNAIFYNLQSTNFHGQINFFQHLTIILQIWHGPWTWFCNFNWRQISDTPLQFHQTRLLE